MTFDKHRVTPDFEDTRPAVFWVHGSGLLNVGGGFGMRYARSDPVERGLHAIGDARRQGIRPAVYRLVAAPNGIGSGSATTSE